MSEKTPSDADYSLSATPAAGTIPIPQLPYKPRNPVSYRPRIGLIACGGITESHLKAYTKAGYDVAALCDLVPERAEARRKQFYPHADVTTDFREVLARPDIEVVDIATHPAERLPLIEAALDAGKHVLSQKPFVLDLREGERLVKLAEQRGVRLAVNQNGRWAPHFSWIRNAVQAGLAGDLMAVHAGVHWDHTWTIGTRFEDIDDLVLYDFAIHWFDFLNSLLGDRPWTYVCATKSHAAGQKARPPMLAQALVGFEGGQASLVFDANVLQDSRDTTFVAGTTATIRSEGANLGEQTVTFTTKDGYCNPELEGSWFPDGFHGSMGELLCAIEEKREPSNCARLNLRGLELCFAAIASANERRFVTPGEINCLP